MGGIFFGALFALFYENIAIFAKEMFLYIIMCNDHGYEK